MRKFPSLELRSIWIECKTRFEIIKGFPKKWHKQNAGIFRIEDKNVLDEWEPFCIAFNKLTLSLAPEIMIDDDLTYKFAFYLQFVALFFKHFSRDEKDTAFWYQAEAYFQKYQAELGVMHEEQLFRNAFPGSGTITKEVICNSIGSAGHLCTECGAAKPHNKQGCEPCPVNKEAKCIPV